MRDYECYHAVCQYSADACNGCEHEMDCYHHFLKHMLRGKKMNRKKVPKYVVKMLQRRTKAARNLRDACVEVDNYCQSIGLDVYHPLFYNACLCSDVRIFCEEGASETTTLEAIEKVLNGEIE